MARSLSETPSAASMSSTPTPSSARGLQPMADKDPKLSLFELYLATAEKVSDRRVQANCWMLSVNSAIVALYGYLQADKMTVGAAQKAVWLWAIPAAGILVCLAWAALLTSYRKLNRAKFAVLMQMEADLPLPPFTRDCRMPKSRTKATLDPKTGCDEAVLPPAPAQAHRQDRIAKLAGGPFGSALNFHLPSHGAAA